MKYGIGIDTGGTYTDAVLYCFDTGAVLATAKALTNRSDLCRSISEALGGLPKELLTQATSVAISTTLATNACVEGKGGRARLVLIGVSDKLLQKADADKKYGLKSEDVLCVDSGSSFDGKSMESVDWDAVLQENSAFFASAEALGVAARNAVRNGAAQEVEARRALTDRFSAPIVLASELAGELNVMERGATALLNARLLPIIQEFMESVQNELNQHGIACRHMTVRSDGSLMGPEMARGKPVETILSGPAASVVGAKTLAEAPNCLVVDIGGTTTDIAVIRDDQPVMTEQIEIGGWRTQIRGVSIETFALGGDTRLYIERSALQLDARRVKPLCALATECPEILAPLRNLVESRRMHTLPLYEFLQLVRTDVDEGRFSREENELIQILRDGPVMLGEGRINAYGAGTERLEREGVILRAGLTPTDIMHLTGDFTAFDARASHLAAQYFLRNLPEYGNGEEDLDAFCADAMEIVQRRLFQHITATLLKASYPRIFGNSGPDGQLERYIEALWRREAGGDALCGLIFAPRGKLIGIGAPTHVFLPRVAEALGMECVIPENAEVANAVGAVVAGVSARVTVGVRPDVEGGYSIHGTDVSDHFEEYEDALLAAQQAAERLARKQAEGMGAGGSLTVHLEVVRRIGHTRSRDEVDLGTDVIASVQVESN